MPTKSTRSAPKPADARPAQRVRVQLASRSRRIPPASRFRSWVRAAAPGATDVTDVTIRLVTVTEGRRLNMAFRGRNYATNVLTFAYDTAHGDIVLCPQIIVREARAQAKSLEAHYAHLTVHAILHLRGHDHKRRTDAARMERAEVRILRRLGHPNPYLI